MSLSLSPSVIRRSSVAFGVAGLLLFQAGCGGDDGGGSVADAPLCRGVAGLDAVDSPGGPDGLTPEQATTFGSQLSPFAAEIKAGLDGRLTGAVATLDGAVTKLQAGDGSPLDDPAIESALSEIRTAAIDDCDFAQVSVPASDFTFEFPETLPEGPFVASMDNTGQEPHVLLLVRKDGADLPPNDELLGQYLSSFEGGAPPAGLTPVPGGMFAAPGTAGSHIYDLQPGSYLYFCPIPSGPEGEGPPHFALGMMGEIKVED